MIPTLAVTVLLALVGPIKPDTVDVPVGSPLVDMRAWRPYTGHVQIAKITNGKVTPLLDARFVTVFRDSAGAPLMFMHSSTGPHTSGFVFDRHTLAPWAVIQPCGVTRFHGTTIDGSQCQGDKPVPIHVNLKTAAFIGDAADLVVEALPRRTDVVYRVVVWKGNDSTETHLYRTTGREDVHVGGRLYRRAWVVDDYLAGTTAPSSRLWLIDKPPYMVRWVFYNAPAAGSEIRADQSARTTP